MSGGKQENRKGLPPDDLLAQAVGAMIFASGEPVHPREIAATFKGLPMEAIEDAIETLRKQFEKQDTGLLVEHVAGGFRLATRPAVAEWVRQFMRQRNRTRLSPAALETLAIVAYRQPVTAPEIQAIRGKDPSGPLKNLIDKRLLRILGKKKVVGRPLLYGTSKDFLVHFGLNSLEDLPSIEDFDEFVGAFAAQTELFEGSTEATESDVEVEVEGEVEGELEGEGEGEGEGEKDAAAAIEGTVEAAGPAAKDNGSAASPVEASGELPPETPGETV